MVRKTALTPDPVITADDRRAATLRKQIAEALEAAHPVLQTMRAHVDAADAIRAAEAGAKKMPLGSTAASVFSPEDRARVDADFDAAFAELDGEMATLRRPQPDASDDRAPGEVRFKARVRAAKLRCEGSEPDADPKLVIDTVSVPIVRSTFAAEVQARLAGGPFEKCAVGNLSGDTESDDDAKYYVTALAEARLKVRPAATNEHVIQAVEALRRAEEELPGREPGARRTPDVFIDFKSEGPDARGDRFIVCTLCSREPDPFTEAYLESPAGRIMGDKHHAAFIREVKTRVELPMTAAEWLGSDLSYPTLANRAKATVEVVGNRSNADHMFAFIAMLLSQDEPEVAASAFRGLALSRLSSSSEVDVTINPPSLAIGRVLRDVSTAHENLMLSKLNGTEAQSRGAVNEHELNEKDREAWEDGVKDAAIGGGKAILGTTIVPEIWSRRLCHTLQVGVTGTMARDFIVASIVSGYADENEYNDSLEEEEMRFVPAAWKVAAVVEQLSSVTLLSPLLRTEVKLQGVNPFDALPKSMSEAATLARQFQLAQKLGERDENGSDSDDENEIEWDWEVDDDNPGRNPRVVEEEQTRAEALGFRARDVHPQMPTPAQRIAKRTAVTIGVVVADPAKHFDQHLWRRNEVLRDSGVPAPALPPAFKRAEEREDDSAMDPVLKAIAARAPLRIVVNGVRVRVVPVRAPAALRWCNVLIAGAVDEPLEDSAFPYKFNGPVVAIDTCEASKKNAAALAQGPASSVMTVQAAELALDAALSLVDKAAFEAAKRPATHPLDW